MNKRSLSVVIPSRTQPRQGEFLERAVASIRTQTVIRDFDVTLLIGVDAGWTPESDIVERLGLRPVESAGRSQAAALNAAIRRVDSDFAAFLEDDDQWYPHYLENVLKAMSVALFVSSTQLEVDEKGAVLRINDFPTPSGWFMSMETLAGVGAFNEEFRFHLDNEWLGRLFEKGISRVHLVESTAPTDPRYSAQVRPWLSKVVKFSGGTTRLMRHDSPFPLVRRLVHSASGMANIEANAAQQEISRREYAALVQRFGRVPW